MTAREKMVAWRTERRLDLEPVAKALDISPGLLDMIETGDVTHPKVAKRIQELMKLTDAETEELVPEIHRKSSDKYEPDKFVHREPEDFDLTKKKKEDIYYHYLHEHSLKGHRT